MGIRRVSERHATSGFSGADDERNRVFSWPPTDAQREIADRFDVSGRLEEARRELAACSWRWYEEGKGEEDARTA